MGGISFSAKLNFRDSKIVVEFSQKFETLHFVLPMNPLRPLFPVLCVGLLPSALSAQDPVLETPGSASWDTVPTDTGFRMMFTIIDDTVFSWDNLNLPSGSQLIFDFIGGESVVNQLGGGAPHIIAGEVIGNGSIGFFSPNADIFLTGNVIADEVTVATMGVDPADFASGGGFEMFGSGSKNRVWVTGGIHATAGNAVLAGTQVVVDDSAVVTASNAVLIGGGTGVSVGGDNLEQLTVSGERGAILHSGTSLAERIEMKAVSAVENLGAIGEGGAQVFIEVGESGRITAESRGLIVDGAVFEGLLEREGVEIGAHEGDAAPVVGDAKLKLPALKRTDGSRVSAARTITTSAPMSASADAGRKRAKKSEDTAERNSDRKALVRRSSFFGMRGGQRDKKAR
jgi:hypothetical protein